MSEPLKNAILITAYKNFDQLVELIRCFDLDEDFNIYIHIDKRKRPDKVVTQKIESFSNVRLVSFKYSVNWGGLNYLKSYLHLSSEALKDQKNTYFHLITAQDFPASPISEFRKLLDCSEQKDYMINQRIPNKNWKGGGMERIEYFHFYDTFDVKEGGEKWISRLVKIQKSVRLRRAFPKKNPALYGGSTYWTLTRPTLQFVVNQANGDSRLIRRMKHTFCPEEMYFQTVIMNSKYAANVENSNLRYIDWSSGRGGYPAVLDSRDFEEIVSSKSLFARKLDSPTSNSLKLMLKDRLNK
ncbi:beta-1,6-N-acetylglucosaminyltransferase [Candidatus Seongchinamella marina]|uniref:beta-1,6-N-acetylglucosaminyltransferase n=1 Tax=Candidatus Seongchinamella marina TaxID=2518990 RepID=UPI00243279AD|nr:beta-1,6-N-acetylglucosaminyltransferase [Candidatus Seongchinamella marina]